MSDVANPAFTIQNMGAKPQVVTTPPADNAPPKIPSDPNKIIEQIKARIGAANPPAPKQAGSATNIGKTGAATDGNQIGTEPKEIVPDAKATLAELAKAQAKVRELSEKAKSFEATASDVTAYKELTELAKKDKLAAITKLIGGEDPETVLADLVTMFYEREGSAPGGDGQPKPAPELKQVLDKLEAVSKELADIKAGKATETEQAQKQTVAQQEQATKAYLKSVVLKHKDMFEISSRDENVDEAMGKAISMVSNPEWAKAAMERLKIENPAQLSAEQAEALAREAIKAAEDEYEQLGKRFGKAKAEPKPSVYDRPFTARAPKLEFSKKPDKETFAEYKARIEAEYLAARGA